MDESKQVGVNEVWAPNRFEVSLSEEDAPRFTPIETPLVTELARLVRDTAAERGWGLVGPPQIELYVDEQLRRGDLDVEASLVEGEDAVAPRRGLLAHGSSCTTAPRSARSPSPPARPSRSAGSPRTTSSSTTAAHRAATRRSAWTRARRSSPTSGSTNGTQLNGRQVQTRALTDGDRIIIGTTLIEYRGS